jgi:hypothetical protein
MKSQTELGGILMHLKYLKLLAVAAIAIGFTLGVTAGYGQQTLNGNQILAKVDERGSFGTGGRVTITQFNIIAKDKTKVEKKFAFFTKTNLKDQPDRLLAYFLEPALERGTIFLSIDPVDPKEKTKLYLYLPALGQTKELVSEKDRNAGFAGSNIQQDNVGRSNYRDDYTAELSGEDSIEGRKTYVLFLTAKAGADVDYPTSRMWVDQQEFLVLKNEGRRPDGKVEQVFEATDLKPFEGRLEANKLIIKNVLENSETQITTLEKRKIDLPDEVFDPKNLKNFDPSKYGVK